jgi:hypothetical protein
MQYQELVTSNTTIHSHRRNGLINARDAVAAIDIAINGSEILYPEAEMAIDRFSHLWFDMELNKELPTEIWNSEFSRKIVELFKRGNSRDLYRSLQLIQKLTRDQPQLECSIELFETLRLMLSQRKMLPIENAQRNGVYLISKNRIQNVDHGVLWLINSFLCSSRNQTIYNVSANTLQIIGNFIGENSPEVNSLSIYVYISIYE